MDAACAAHKYKDLIVKRVILLSCSLILVLIITIMLIPIFRTTISVTKINIRPVYECTDYFDYKLDNYLHEGANSNEELERFLIKDVSTEFFMHIGCSAFYARNPEGDIIFARDLDTFSAVPCVINTESSVTGKVFGMTNLCNIMKGDFERLSVFNKMKVIISPYLTTDGMNEYGFSAAMFTANGSTSTDDIHKKTLFHWTVVRCLLDKAKNVEDAIEFLRQFNIGFENDNQSQYMLADASGKCVIVEYINGKMELLPITGNYQICTNFLIINNKSLRGYGSDRYKNYDIVLKNCNGVISEDAALDLLKKNVIPNQGQWSVVYNLSKRKIFVEYSGDSTNKKYIYSIK